MWCTVFLEALCVYGPLTVYCPKLQLTERSNFLLNIIKMGRDFYFYVTGETVEKFDYFKALSTVFVSRHNDHLYPELNLRVEDVQTKIKNLLGLLMISDDSEDEENKEDESQEFHPDASDIAEAISVYAQMLKTALDRCCSFIQVSYS
jgi:hypothetical protein